MPLLYFLGDGPDDEMDWIGLYQIRWGMEERGEYRGWLFLSFCLVIMVNSGDGTGVHPLGTNNDHSCHRRTHHSKTNAVVVALFLLCHVTFHATPHFFFPFFARLPGYT